MRRALVALALAGALPVGAPAVACAAEANAAVHVIGGDGRDLARCVAIEPGATTGIDALRRAGVTLTTEEFAGAGSLVCAIDGVGSRFPDAPCVPPCAAGRCRFWAYLTRERGGPWRFSSIGASTRILRDGDADAWVYGTHAIGRVETLPVTDDAVCQRGVSAVAAVSRGALTLGGVAPFGLAALFAFAATRRMRRRGAA